MRVSAQKLAVALTALCAVSYLGLLSGRGPTPPASAWAALALGLPAPPARLGVGRALPALVLLDAEGLEVDLHALGGRPLWLAFFRGAYCPSCRKQLGLLGARAAEIARAGVQLFAISPDPPARSARLRSELGLSFPVLSDPGERAVTALCAGLGHCQLLVDAQGVVRWAGWSESWSESPTPDALLQAAQRLSPPWL